MCVLCIIKWWAMDEYISTQGGTASLQCRSARILKITSHNISFSCSHLHCLLFTVIFKHVDCIPFFFLLCSSKFTLKLSFLLCITCMVHQVAISLQAVVEHNCCPRWAEQVVCQVPCVTTLTLNNIKHMCNTKTWTQSFISLSLSLFVSPSLL